MAQSATRLVEFSLVGPRGKLVTETPKSKKESKEESLVAGNGDRVHNTHGEVSAQEMFAPLNDPNYLQSIQKINLATKSFTLPATKLLCEKIRQMHNLVVVDMSDTISGIMANEAEPVLKEFAKAFEGLPNLREIHCNRNAIGPRVSYFEKVWTGQLTAVTLTVTGMSALACQILAQAFIKNGPLPLQLRTLHFAESTSDSGGAIAISTMFEHCPFLEDFRMASVRSASDGMEAICNQLASAAPPLRALDLSDNSFTEDTDVSGSLNSALLVLAPTLRRLTLKSICIGKDGFGLIHEGLRSCLHLEVLEFDDSDVDDFSEVPEFAEVLADALPELRELSLGEFFVDDSGAHSLAESFRSRGNHRRPCLRVLNLRNNGIPDSAFAALLPSIAAMQQTSGGGPGFNDGGLQLDDNLLSQSSITYVTNLFAAANRSQELAPIASSDNPGGVTITSAPLLSLIHI